MTEEYDYPDYYPGDYEDNNAAENDPTVRVSLATSAPDYGYSAAPDQDHAKDNKNGVAENHAAHNPQMAAVYFPRTLSPPPPPPLARESAARQRARKRYGKSRKSGGEWAWVIIAGVMLSVVIIFGMIVLLLVQSPSANSTVLPTSAIDLSNLPTPVNFQSDNNIVASGRSITLDNGFSMILEPWDGESRFTLLAMGIDRRPDERGLTYRTDTMMLISIDPNNNSMGILSIPRDLYIAVPGYAERQRANSAMVLGETNQAGAGPDLAMRSIQYNLGIRVHDYVVVDFKAVIDLINAVNGIEVSIDYTINDPQYPNMYYGYDPFYLAAGTHQLNGETALKFARTRHGDSDIERAGRQQQVLYAVRDKVLELDMLPQLIVQAPSLLSSLSDNVQTGLTLQQMIELAWYVKDIPDENITTGVIGFEYIMNYTTNSGAQVLIPNAQTISRLMVEVFGPNYSE